MIWISQRKEKKRKEKVNVVRYDFEMIVKKKTKHNLKTLNLPNPKRRRFSEFN
jgi:hypothetical protein